MVTTYMYSTWAEGPNDFSGLPQYQYQKIFLEKHFGLKDPPNSYLQYLHGQQVHPLSLCPSAFLSSRAKAKVSHLPYRQI